MPRGLSAREFAIDLKKFGEVTKQQARLIFRKIIIDLDQAVVLRTPVDTGRARGNWYPSLNTPSTRRNDNAKDKNGTAANKRVDATAAKADVGDVAWLTNNLPYILVLENGSSKQARQGMVDVELNRAAAQYGGSIRR